MKFAKLVVALLLVVACAAASFAADGGEAGVITTVVRAHLPKEAVESVYVEKVVGDFALAIVSIKDSDGGIAYLKKNGSSWSVLSYGNPVTEAGLVALGVPGDIAKKLAD